MNIHHVIKKPLVTEKSNTLKDLQGQYVFVVDRNATKYDVKLAIEKLFEVKVKEVHTVTVRGKVKRVGRHLGQMSNWKKAFVTLIPGHTINIFEGS